LSSNVNDVVAMIVLQIWICILAQKCLHDLYISSESCEMNCSESFFTLHVYEIHRLWGLRDNALPTYTDLVLKIRIICLIKHYIKYQFHGSRAIVLTSEVQYSLFS
jgi:hypothetical protein